MTPWWTAQVPDMSKPPALDVRVILVAEVVEHLVDGIDNRSVALVYLIGIREQIAFQKDPAAAVENFFR